MESLNRGCPVSVGDDVWIGAGAIVVGPCRIGNGEHPCAST
jgi:acetyltransferase-like isoleucine patch superfamily enzyme